MEMSSVIDVGGKQVNLSVESGHAVGVRRLSETHVTGHVSQGSGRVTSRVVKKTEFALIDLEGVERPHWFSSHDMYLRDGHRVSLIHASYRGSMWAYIINHDTKLALMIWDPSSYIYHLGLVTRIGLMWFVLAIAAIVGLFQWMPESKSVSGPLFGSVLGGLIVLKIIQWWRARSLWTKYLYPEFERIEKALLSMN